ncbi:MAG: helix-turn-helix domain-containing protein [Chloracidobacterium sp.]|nr:helix-turn-helix domain-containing protein [Chloracidobacterium sp.]
MENEDFVRRLDKAFEHQSMADVARRLRIPHATVRNYYNGRLPASDVLIKIARESGVSIDWLLLGKGEMYIGDTRGVDIGRFIENKITELIDEKLAGTGREAIRDLGTIDEFDVEAAVQRLNDPQAVMQEWFRHEGREYPEDYGIAFFRGWESFNSRQKAEAVRDAKRVLDRSYPKR